MAIEAEYRNFGLDDRRLTRGEMAVLVVCLLAAFVAGCFAINLTVTRVTWRPDLGIVDRKLEALVKIRDQVNLIFMGTSRYNQGIEPKIFDEAAREHGYQITSFNMSLENMSCEEYWMCLDEIGRLDLPNLRWVIVEPSVNLTPPLHNWMTTRVRYYARWNLIAPAIRAKWTADRDLQRRSLAVASLLAVSAIHTSNLGVLSDLLLPELPANTGNDPAIERGGPFEQYLPSVDEERKRRYARWFERYGAAYLTKLRAEDDHPTPSDEEVEIQNMVFNRIEGLGARPIVCFPPRADDMRSQYVSEQAVILARPDIPRLTYYFGTGHEELYENLDWWRDIGHLSLAGATHFSTLLAADFSRVAGEP